MTNTNPNPTYHLNLNLLQPKDQLSIHPSSTRSNTSIGESEISFMSCHTAATGTEQRFVCHFHGMDIVSKHTTKNKFYCEHCQVNPEYVHEYNYNILAEDLNYLHDYIKSEHIEIDFDLKNLLKLNQI